MTLIILFKQFFTFLFFRCLKRVKLPNELTENCRVCTFRSDLDRRRSTSSIIKPAGDPVKVPADWPAVGFAAPTIRHSHVSTSDHQKHWPLPTPAGCRYVAMHHVDTSKLSKTLIKIHTVLVCRALENISSITNKVLSITRRQWLQFKLQC